MYTAGMSSRNSNSRMYQFLGGSRAGTFILGKWVVLWMGSKSCCDGRMYVVLWRVESVEMAWEDCIVAGTGGQGGVQCAEVAKFVVESAKELSCVACC